MALTYKTKIGIGKEATWGTKTSNWNTLPVNPPTFTPTYDNILDQGLRGVGARDFSVQRGAGQTEATLEGVFYPEELGYLLYGILGSATVTGGTPWTHTFKLGELTPSFSIEDQVNPGSPGQTPEQIAYDYLGMTMSSLVLRFNAGEGAVGWTAAFTGKGYGTAAPASLPAVGEGTPSAPLTGWQGSVDFGGVTDYCRLVDCEWTFAREVVMVHTLHNTQEPYYGYSGPLEVTMRATVEFHTDADLALYRTGEEFSMKVWLQRGAAATQKSLAIESSKIFFENAPEIDRGAINVRLNMAMRARYDATPGSATPVTVTLINSKSSYAT